jgi:predicted hydrocarbon binding protein
MTQRFILPFIASIPEKGLRSIYLELENTPGTLVSALEVVSAAGLNIVGMVSNVAMTPEQTFQAILFVDVGDYSDDQIEGLLKLIEKKRGVRRLLMHKHEPEQTSIAPFYSELGIYEFRAVVITENELAELLTSLYEKLGESGAQAFLYHLGVPLGRAEAKYFKKILPNMGKQAPLEVIPLTSLGWCHAIDIERQDSDTLKLKTHGLIECMILKGRIEHPSSHLIRGFLAGYISEIMGGEWEVKEQTCTAKGAEACIFTAKKIK